MLGYEPSVSGDASSLDVISENLFGAVYTGFRNFSGFRQQAEELSVTHIRWPGGTLSEVQESVYSLSNPEIFDGRYLYNYSEFRNRPGLTEMFEYCVDQGMGFTIIIPTARYLDELEIGSADVENLISNIASGAFGDLPSQLTFEFGNEHYGLDEFEVTPARYGEVANHLLESLNAELAMHGTAFEAVDVDIAVQMGRDYLSDAAIRSEFSASALESIDTLVFHHLPISLKNMHSTTQAGSPEDLGRNKFQKTASYLQAWNEGASSALGAEVNYELYMSAWSVGGTGNSVEDLNIDYRDYGLKAAPTAVELIWNYAMIGVDQAAAWGVGSKNRNWFSFKEEGQNEFSPLGEIYRLMAESLPGTKPLALDYLNDIDGDFLVHGFDGDDRAVFYVSALDLEFDRGAFTLDLSGLGEIGASHVRQLNVAWREDEMIEGTATKPIVTEFAPDAVEGVYEFQFTQDYQVIELSVELPSGFDWGDSVGHDGSDATDEQAQYREVMVCSGPAFFDESLILLSESMMLLDELSEDDPDFFGAFDEVGPEQFAALEPEFVPPVDDFLF